MLFNGTYKKREIKHNHFELTPSVLKGDKLQFKLKTGEERWFTVASIKPDSLISTSGDEYFWSRFKILIVEKYLL
ncbi:hypothetical protein [Salmonella enterica]|uniref:hypothetical protein n=1 Tax=Salmonella enterica TaxID=28901 RepID=UPI001588B46D|nr:hypothetical protein [Salmonella enterica]QKW88313.1 hypothetical protein FOC26_23050 [Salmonella enterica]